MILQSNPGAGYFAHKSEIDAAVRECLESRWYILGAQVKAFETEFAAFLEAQNCVGVASGTDALQVALKTLEIGRGDVVFCPSHTAVATVTAIELCGATPYFVDVYPSCLTLSVADLKIAIARAKNENIGNLKAVIAVHLYGQSAHIEAIHNIARENGLRLIEDCAQSHGARRLGKTTGNWGDMAAFSFYPTKNLGALGDGGAVVCNDEELAARARLVREYGWRERYVSAIAGMNSRLDELQAAILRVKLRHLSAGNARRAQIAALYSQILADCELELPFVHDGNEVVWHQYVIRVSSGRDQLQAFLKEQNIGTLVHYPVPVHLQPAYQTWATRALPETERAAREVLSLPIYPELSEQEVETVAQNLKNWCLENR